MRYDASRLKHYIHDGQAIYRQSFSIIRREADLARFTPEEEHIAVRLIHACGRTDIAPRIFFAKGFAQAARSALRRGCPVFCDSAMVAHGITRARLPADNEVICTLRHPDTPALAQKLGNTRSAAAIHLWGPRLKGALVAVGNAPTALFHLMELIEAGQAPLPAAIIGMPVGFVGAEESKNELIAWGKVPFATVSGREGGSAMAAACVNAIASDAL